MKPFNLEEAKAGKPVQTKAGNPVRIICFDKVSTDFRPIVALVTCNDSSGEFEMLIRASPDGSVLLGNMYDLCMAPVKHAGWVNIYSMFANHHTADGVYLTKEDAINSARDTLEYLRATIYIEWEE